MPTNETNLEQIFSDLAYTHLRDKSQALIDYLVGFQMLKQEDDGARAVGIFGFEIDDSFYYAPVFFLNGEIRGLDSLYSVKSDLFVPLTEDWVNTIINRQNQALGEADRRSLSQRGVRLPDYTRLKVVPGGPGGVNLKMGSATVSFPPEYRNEQVPNLPEALASAGLTAWFKTAMEKNPRLADLVTQHYTWMDFGVDPVETKVAAEAEPVTIIGSITDEGVDALTDEQKRRVVEGGRVVLDNRPEIVKSELIASETAKVLENPTGGGLYDVLWSDGSITTALISTTGDLNNDIVVFRVDDKKHAQVQSRVVWVVRKYSQVVLEQWFKDHAVKASEARPGNTGVFMSLTGEGTGGFCLENKRGGLDGTTVYRVRDRYYMDAKGLGSSGCVGPSMGADRRGNNGDALPNLFRPLWFLGDVNRSGNPSQQVQEVIVVERGQPSPRYAGIRCVVNDNDFHFIELNSFKLSKPEGNWDLGAQETYAEPRYDVLLSMADFGTPATIAEALDKYAPDVKVWGDRSETSVKVGSAPVVTAAANQMFRHLVIDHGLRGDDAEFLLKEASREPKVFKIRYGCSKTAAELLQIPDQNDRNNEGGFMNAYVPSQIPYQATTKAQSPDNREFYRYDSPFGPGAGTSGDDSNSGPDTMSTVEDAAKTGDKEVFDASAMASLIKAHEPTDLVDRFMPTITAGMDRLGRFLFLINWHYADFEERYGEKDLGDFIDNLRSVFEQLGDVITFAKRKSLAGDPEHYGVGMNPLLAGETE